jgi:cell division transport system permease protein
MGLTKTKTLFLAQEATRGLRKNMTMTIALILTVMVSLSLFGTGLLVQRQVTTMKDYWYDKVELSVFLCGPGAGSSVCPAQVTGKQRDTVRETLEANPGVASVYYESSEEAYSHFKEQFANSPILNSVTSDALPESFRVKLKSPGDYDSVSAAVAGLAGVEQVRDQKALLQQFFSLMSGVQKAALGAAVCMLGVTVLLILNTVRLSAYARRKETGIMKLVGATNLSVALPFVLEAVLAAVVGAAASVGVLFAVQQFVVEGKLMNTYKFTSFITWPDVFGVALIVLLVGLVVSAAAASVSVKKYLRV